ncbi:Kinase domain containing protein [Ceratobasidium theobromae]|uniref:Kinase domain containing protein n=1 Tax=Ceratobasidium theobromae TaxID=1582974 RepID=A0A5N5QAX8_9AGAM|nr:Kinase domain containing protein [Ceratobasidium theobromae]
MSGSVSTDKVVLNILIEGEDPRYDVFNVYIPRDITFGDLEDAIRATYEGKRYEPLGPLTLFKFNRPGEDYVGVTRKMMLDKLDKVDSASGWPAGSRIDDYMIHIVARIKVPRVVPSDQDDLRALQERNEEQANYLQSLEKYTSSQAAAPETFQRLQGWEDKYINVGRPHTGPSIVLHHPVFGRFLERLESSEPIPATICAQTIEYLTISQQVYENEAEREKLTREVLGSLLGDDFGLSSAVDDQPDGTTTGRGGASCILMEVKNEIEDADCDPSIHVAQTYARWWKDKSLLAQCCCPSILIAIVGPWMCILGAVYLERPTVQPLTDFMWIAYNPINPFGSDRIARAFHCARLARDELEVFYKNPPDLKDNLQRYFPYITHYTDPTGHRVDFKYKSNLAPVVYLAQTCQDPPRLIVVKFVERYNSEAHKLLAEAKLAPELLYDGTAYPNDQPGPIHTMIVMEYINAIDLARYDKPRAPDFVRTSVDKAIGLLHAHDFVFGDLRNQNVMLLQDADEVVTGAMLIDFDWCGKDSVARYPFNMNPKIWWPDGIGPGKYMKKCCDDELRKYLSLDP